MSVSVVSEWVAKIGQIALIALIALIVPHPFSNVARATKQWTIDNGKRIAPRVYRTIVNCPLSVINWIVARATFLFACIAAVGFDERLA